MAVDIRGQLLALYITLADVRDRAQVGEAVGAVQAASVETVTLAGC